MTTDAEVKYKWEDIDSLEVLKLGDELEYTCPGTNKEFRYWGKVIDIQRKSGEIIAVRMEGDWTLLPSSLTDTRMQNKLTRKVVEFVWPEYVGTCVESTRDGAVNHYVRVAAWGPKEWVHAESGELYATWEMELVTAHDERRVLGRGF